MLHLILTHHVTAPSLPIAPQTRDSKKPRCLPMRLTSRSALGSPIGQRHTHTPPVRGEHPACSRNCQAGLTAGTPCCALRGLSGSPFLAVTLTEAIRQDRRAWPWKLFLPFPERTYRCRPPPLQSPNKEPFVTTFAPGLLTQRLPFAWPSTTPIGKLAQTIEPPFPVSPGRTQSPARVCVGPGARRPHGELAAGR